METDMVGKGWNFEDERARNIPVHMTQHPRMVVKSTAGINRDEQMIEEAEMTTRRIYEAARERGLVQSQRQFSRELLGMAANYAADTGFARCSPAALLNLHRRLGEVGQADLQAMVGQHLLGVEASVCGSATRA
jgi:hypothetical protein